MFDAPIFPEQASTHAGSTDLMLLVLMLFSAFFTVVIFAAIVYFIIRYHHGRKVNRKNISVTSTKVEVAWMIIPGVMLVGLFIGGARIYFMKQQPPTDTMDIYVVGKQWMWKLQHPEGQREINALHVPIHQPVRLWMTSQDVIHSFFVPAFRMKQDVLPGRYTTTWFEATEEGEFHLFCAEYCGTEHSQMIGKVIVMQPDQYARWLVTTSAGETMASQGKQYFQQLGCSGCHGARPSVPAPKLDGLYGRLVTLQSGEVVEADANYIRDSILLPSKHIVAGYEDQMPSFQGQVSEEELFSLLEYIKSLSEDRP